MSLKVKELKMFRLIKGNNVINIINDDLKNIYFLLCNNSL